MRVVIIGIIASIFIALCIGIWGGDSQESNLRYPLVEYYSLSIQPQAGREFNFGQSLTYTAKKSGNQLVFETSYSQTKSLLLGKRNQLWSSMTIDSRTLTGTWVSIVNGQSQGGTVTLTPNPNGFAITSWSMYGPWAGYPPAIGQLLALPD
jgi:hypothetical protein